MEERDMKTRGLLTIGCVVALCAESFGAVGTWKNFTSMKEVRSLTRQGTSYWAATSGGLFGWGAAKDSYQLFTNAEGLQSTDLTAVGIDGQGSIWTGTSTGFIHVYSPQNGSWRYIPDIANTNQTNKGINSFTMLGDTVFVCTAFGMSVFRLNEFGFGDTYSRFGSLSGNIRVSVSSAVVFDDSLWLTVSDGLNVSRVAVASLATPNLLPPEAWTLLTVGNSTVVPNQVAVFNGKLYAATSAGVFAYQAGNWNALPALSGVNTIALSPSSGYLNVTTTSQAFVVDQQENVQPFGNILPFQASSLVADGAGLPVIGTAEGILTFAANDSTWRSHVPNGPNSNQFLSVAVNIDGTVWAASGSSNGKGIYRYNGHDWKSFSMQNSPALLSNDFYRVSVGCNGSVWACSWGRGAVEFPPGLDYVDPAHVYGLNVGLVGIPGDTTYIVPSTVVCDGSGNTWVTIVAAADKRLVAVRKADGTWVRFPVYLNSTTQIANLMDHQANRCLAIDPFGNLWSIVRQDEYLGVISLGNGGVIGDSTIAYFLTINDGLPSNSITDIVVDLDGQIWLGTDKGIGIIVDPDQPTRTGGIAGYVPLRGTAINCVTVDALNQKWIGTPDGVVVLSPDGTQEVASYTVASTNGKLIDDDVKSIAIDGNTGTVYFGTLFGLASLTTVAASPLPTFSKLSIAPNPLIVPTSSLVTIDGLVENSTLKVLSIDGRLVREIKTPGGRIGFWDGKDEQGSFVSSGIYIIVASSDKDETVAKAKIAVIRR